MFNAVYHGRINHSPYMQNMELQYPIINEQINSPLIFHTSGGCSEAEHRVGGDKEYSYGSSPQPSASGSGISSDSKDSKGRKLNKFKPDRKPKAKKKKDYKESKESKESTPEWSGEPTSNTSLIQHRLQLFLAMNYQHDPDTGDLVCRYDEDVSDAPPDLGRSLQTIEKLTKSSEEDDEGRNELPSNSHELARSGRIEILTFFINEILRASGLIPRGENWYALTQFVSLSNTTPSIEDFSPVTSSASSMSSTFSHTMTSPSPQTLSVDILLNLSDAERILGRSNVYQARISLHFTSTACHPTTMMKFKDTFFPTITHNFRYLTPHSNPGGIKHVNLPSDMVLLTTEVVVV